MPRYVLCHLSDQTLLHDLGALVARDRTTAAELLAHIAEVDARKLYLPAAHPSMYAYCVGELHLSEEAAFKRIQAARVARRFPAIFEAVAEGRLHLSAVVLLAPHLSEETADELLAAATHKSKAEIERLLAERFPRPDLLAWVEAIPASSVTRSVAQHAPGRVEHQLSAGKVEGQPAPEPALAQPALGRVRDRSRVKPLAPQSFAVQFTMSQRAHEKLRHAQELLGHQVPTGDIAEVFERALDALIRRLEKNKFAATTRPGRSGCPSTNPRHVPAHVKRAVWARDGGRCTFCEAAPRDQVLLLLVGRLGLSARPGLPVLLVVRCESPVCRRGSSSFCSRSTRATLGAPAQGEAAMERRRPLRRGRGLQPTCTSRSSAP